MSQDAPDLAQQLAACGPHLSTEEWRDFLEAGDEAAQRRILETYTLAAVPPGTDYWAAVLDVLRVAGAVVGVVTGVLSGVQIVQSLARS